MGALAQPISSHREWHWAGWALCGDSEAAVILGKIPQTRVRLYSDMRIACEVVQIHLTRLRTCGAPYEGQVSEVSEEGLRLLVPLYSEVPWSAASFVIHLYSLRVDLMSKIVWRNGIYQYSFVVRIGISTVCSPCSFRANSRLYCALRFALRFQLRARQ